ncbi:hypothetical protein ACQP3C_30710, partial [Escherichia coli]
PLIFFSEADQSRKWQLLREKVASPKTEPSRLVTGKRQALGNQADECRRQDDLGSKGLKKKRK